MKNYIPTIEELLRIEVPELNVIFRKAAEVAADETCDPTELAAAKQTMENIRRSQTRSPQP